MALVKSSKIMTVAMMVVSAAYATSPYDDQIGSVLEDMVSTNREVRLNVTNRLDALIEVTTNGNQLTTCKLLKAKLRTECADIMGDEQVYDCHAFHDATNLCFDVLRYSTPFPSSWQRYGAVFTLALPLSMDRQHQMMYSIATNALEVLDAQCEISTDTNVFAVLYGPESLRPGYMRDMVRTLAAVTLSLSDNAADISAYTNGLPTQAIQVIEDIRGE